MAAPAGAKVTGANAAAATWPPQPGYRNRATATGPLQRGRRRSTPPMPPAAPSVPRTGLGTAEGAVGAGAVMFMGGSLMAADTQRFRLRHRFTHGVEDRPGRQEAGKQFTITT
jgi:hypothetical protein